jgi:hypothetical protein
MNAEYKKEGTQAEEFLFQKEHNHGTAAKKPAALS